MRVNILIQRWGEQPFIPRSLPFALYIAFLALVPLLDASQEFDLRWLYGVQISVVALALVMFWSRYGEINTGLHLSLAHWLVSVACGITVFVLWINLDQGWAAFDSGKGYVPLQADGTLHWSLIAVRILGAAVVVPVMEELFWRSMVMRWIERPAFLDVAPAAVGLRAIAMSSVVFGLEHSLWLAGILAGVAYAWIYRRTGNLWAPIIAHAVTNLLLGVWVVATGNWQFW